MKNITVTENKKVIHGRFSDEIQRKIQVIEQLKYEEAKKMMYVMKLVDSLKIYT